MNLEVRHLAFRHPNASSDLFSDVSFQLPAAGFHALFGPSGVGKTTLARMLTGDIRNFHGEISRDGSRRVLYTYNLERLPGWSSVRRHIEETAPPARRRQAGELIAEFGIEGCVDARFSRLSMGQQNRANLVRYLLQEFEVLIMDESLANVDELTREKIILKIKALFPERCFLYISHNVAEVARFCGRVLVLRAASKAPQVVCIQGADQAAERPAPPPQLLERAMLEIVHAA
ncbi:MAG: ATP-binding cassette domain-containing protein [Desulfobacterales bacterium]|jgi:ABC-type nitrate/sulfonate/bicarbonate transport system ATPase subunit|nr:ATP-binding cassette domain-containing protein [Desulfobacterales bacterium]